MKIGLVLFGHLRSFRSSFDSYKNFLNTLKQTGDVDVFCHTWDIKESVSQSWWKNKDSGNAPPETIDESEIVSKYAPVLYEVEASKTFEAPDLGIESIIPVPGILSMLYSQLRAFELLKRHEQYIGKTYDVILKSRYDILYDIAPDFSLSLYKAKEKNCIFLPSSNPYELVEAYSDIFAICSRQQAEVYFQFNRNLEEATNLYKNEGFKQIVPELLMSFFLKQKNSILYEITSIRISILRMSGDKFQINSCQEFDQNSPQCFYHQTIEKCNKLFQHDPILIQKNISRAIYKYLSWINKQADDGQLARYALYFNGEWITLYQTAHLAKLSMRSEIFKPEVMKNFFEQAIRNARYGWIKKTAQAICLTIFSRYGIFFIRVIVNIYRKNKSSLTK